MPEIPSDNSLTIERINLGKRLFFDNRLSRDSSLNCSSCHLPSLAYSDSIAISNGVDGRKGFRNAPSLVNTAYLDRINKDGGVSKLGLQAFVPIEDHDEMDLSVVQLIKRLESDDEYQQMSEAAYGRKIDPFVISRALAAFERTLISGNSKYDQFMNGDSTALNEKEKVGMLLFHSEKAACSGCHSGFNFTNNEFLDNGVYASHSDQGRKRATSKESDRGKFRVPSLRNIYLTAPYMHDGGLESLEEVINHYNSGGKASPNKDERIKQLNLSELEKSSLIAFLKTLTDKEFISRQEAY